MNKKKAKVKVKITELEFDKKLVKKWKKYGYTIERAINEFLEHNLEEGLENIEASIEREKRFKRMACKKCGGIKVVDFGTSKMAAAYGKRCTCKVKGK